MRVLPTGGLFNTPRTVSLGLDQHDSDCFCGGTGSHFASIFRNDGSVIVVDAVCFAHNQNIARGVDVDAVGSPSVIHNEKVCGVSLDS